MAKNDYGIQLMAWSFVGYAVTSLIAGIQAAMDRRKPKMLAFEYFVLVIVFGIICMRIMLIRFPYIELLFSTAGLALVVFYGKHLLDLRKGLGNKRLTTFLSLFYGSLMVYLLAMSLNPISNYFSELIAVVAILVLVISFLARLRIRSIELKGKPVSIGNFLSKQPNNSVILVSLLGVYTIYVIALIVNIVPDIHSRNMPEGYYNLVEKADIGEDKGTAGKFEYQIYKEHLDKFYKNRGLQD